MIGGDWSTVVFNPPTGEVVTFHVVNATQEMIADLGETVAEVFFTRWHTAFMAKSQGGHDEFLQEWAPLAPSTIKRKQQTQNNWAQIGPAYQEKRASWRAQDLMRHFQSEGYDKVDANAMAVSMVWGATETAGGVPIHVDTERLAESLHPDGSPDQVKEVDGTSMTFGTSVPYAGDCDRGDPSKNRPARRIKPTKTEASEWVRAAAVVARNDLAERLQGEL